MIPRVAFGLRKQLAAAALVAVAAAAAGRPADAGACSTGRILWARAPLFVLATARPDTVRAGPGPVRYTVPAPRDPASIHGQLFRLDRVGGDVPPELARARAEGRTEAVLVPYGAECRDVWRWTESARWVAPGTQTMADAQLRPRAQWIGGRPTFDVEPGHDAYPRGYERYHREDDDTPALTSAQLFELTEALPTFDEAERAPFAYRRVLRWASTHPRLAQRFPANIILREVHDAVQPCVPAYDPHPLAGTYRLTVVAARSDTVRGVMRTAPRGFPQCGPVEPRLDLTAKRPRPADTARLYVRTVSTEEAFTAGATPNASRCGYGIADVVNRPRRAADGTRHWEADFNYGVLGACFPQSARLREATDAVLKAYMAGERGNLPGTFQEEPGGAARFEQIWRVNGQPVLEVRADRMSGATLPLR
jgi:hypothetical protein